MSLDEPGQSPGAPQEPTPTPLVGYRDMPQPTGRARYQLQSWLILAAMMVVYLIWCLAVYFFEPGIR